MAATAAWQCCLTHALCCGTVLPVASCAHTQNSKAHRRTAPIASTPVWRAARALTAPPPCQPLPSTRWPRRRPLRVSCWAASSIREATAGWLPALELHAPPLAQPVNPTNRRCMACRRAGAGGRQQHHLPGVQRQRGGIRLLLRVRGAAVPGLRYLGCCVEPCNLLKLHCKHLYPAMHPETHSSQSATPLMVQLVPERRGCGGTDAARCRFLPGLHIARAPLQPD